MKIYTKTGDKGETSLFGGERVWKNNLRIECYGTVDELNAVIGLSLTEIKNQEIIDALSKIQNDLFVLGSDLATPEKQSGNQPSVPRIQNDHSKTIEKQIDYFDSQLPELRNFILPGGSKGSSLLHLARTVCRRGERLVVNLFNQEKISEEIVVYLNRLSDLLFVLSRFENFTSNIKDTCWKP